MSTARPALHVHRVGTIACVVGFSAFALGYGITCALDEWLRRFAYRVAIRAALDMRWMVARA